MQNGAYRRRTTASIISSVALAAASATLGLPLWSHQAQAQTAKSKGPAQQSQPDVAVTSPLVAVVSIGRQRVTFYDKNGAVAQSPISSGARGHDTPQGVFSIIGKEVEHNSNLYDDASMPFMQRLTWSGVAMHAGALPGYPASHGCIRLPYGFAERIFKMTKFNTRVVVMQGEVAPMPIRHANLFQPKLVEAAVSRAAPDATPGVTGEPARPDRAQPTFRLDDGANGPETPMMLGGRLAKPEVAEATDSSLKPQKAVISPLQAARAQKQAAIDNAAVAAKNADTAKLVHKASLAEVGKVFRSIGPAEAAQRRAEAKAKQLERAAALAKTDELKEKALAEHAKTLAEAAAAAAAAADARANLADRKKAVTVSLEAAKNAEKARVAALAEAKAAERLVDPVSVFVSRKTGRLYIRQGRTPVTDMPITIKDPQKPIGTHVFTVMDQTDGGHGVRWNVVNVDAAGVQQTEAPAKSKNKKDEKPAARATVTAAGVGSAALDRIEFPPEALARITPYLQPGSSLIVSDLGLSVETGLGTDFVIQTRGEAESIESQRRWAEERRSGRSRNRDD